MTDSLSLEGIFAKIQELSNRNDFLEERVLELLAANNRELEDRRSYQKEARRCRKALAHVKAIGDRLGHLPWSVMDQVIVPALAGKDSLNLWFPREEEARDIERP